MDEFRIQAADVARHYFSTSGPLLELGWGVSGCVLLSPDGTHAVKVLREADGFDAERKTYERLRKLDITTLHGLTIPKLRGYDEDLKLIDMDCVRPPFLLDFAGVHFSKPDFSEDVWNDWHEKIEERFGRNSWIAYAVYNSLQMHGIYYLDLRPSNLNLEGHPDASMGTDGSNNEV